jgi:predicted N-formylglutamate amidohydrolase
MARPARADYPAPEMKQSDDLEEQSGSAGEEAFRPFVTIDGDLASGLLIICDHAANAVPAEYGDLGLPAAEFHRHIAYDPGAAAVTRMMASRLGAPAVLSTFSRLLIDANRGEDDPTLIMKLSDGAVVPGNAAVDGDERARRIRRFHAPYHAEIAATLAQMRATGVVPAIFSVHSFTPIWRGARRPWHAGVLWDKDPRFALPLIDALREDASLVVGDNEPYAGALKNDTLNRHATVAGLTHALIEVRQDLIADEAGVAAWSERLSAIVARLTLDPAMHEVRFYGSRADE